MLDLLDLFQQVNETAKDVNKPTHTASLDQQKEGVQQQDLLMKMYTQKKVKRKPPFCVDLSRVDAEIQSDKTIVPD